MHHATLSKIALFILSTGAVAAYPCQTCQKTLESRDADPNNITQRRLDVQVSDTSRPVIRDQGFVKERRGDNTEEDKREERTETPPSPQPYVESPADHERQKHVEKD